MAGGNYTYSYRSSRWSAYAMLPISLLFFGVVIYSSADGKAQEGSVLFLVLIGAVFLWLGLKNILRKGPDLQLSQTGIWTAKIGHVEWSRIKIQFRHASAFKSGSIYGIAILNRATNEQLDWVATGITDVENSNIKHELNRLKQGYAD